jgi:hypothetical protein
VKHIYEHEGVMLEVLYSRDPALEEEVIFHSVRTLDSQYRPTGPDLTPLLHTACIVEHEVPGGDSEAVRFLSAIIEELP